MVNAHLAAIVESSDDAIVSKDLNGVVQTWNKGAERVFGYAAQEIVGRSITTLIPDERLMEEDMILDRIRRGDRVDHMQTVRRRKDGSFVDVSVTVSPIRDETGTVVGASKVARDISDRVVADALNARLAAIVESSDDAVVSKDLNGVVQTWNRGAERLFGYLAEEMVGQPILILLPEDRKDEETRILERLRRGERIDHFETVRMRKDGRLIDVSVTISPIRDRMGRVVGASKVARDISERKAFEAATAAFTHELETRVRERTVALETANREMEAFTYSIAHDIRAPLRAIVSTSAVLMEEHAPELSPELVSSLSRQANSAKYLARLVDDLLTYARLARAEVARESVDLTALARRAADLLHAPDHTFRVEEGLVAQGDPALLGALLQNLLDNAVKYSPGGGEISVGRAGNAFYVRDGGTGFDMAFAEKIFKPFERLVRHEDVPGTGIGLAQAKRVVEKHGGTIWANSILDEGTTVYFTLPR